MASTNGTRNLMDWRDITERLLDPQQRRAIVTKTDTDELQQMKTKNAFTKRKRRLLDQIRKNKNLNKNNNTKRSDDKSDRSPNTSPRSSRCSELNFSNDEVPSTPPPTLPPTNAAFPSVPIRSNGHRPLAPPVAATAAKGSGSDSDSGAIDMGDYEHRIRPSSAFWRKKDGMSLAEKIIFYRNWKYRNFPRSEDNHQTAGEMESTLTDYRRLRTTRQAAKSAATVRHRNNPEEDRQRPVTVIPKVSERVPVAFPPIESTRQVTVTSSHHDDQMERLPAIEMNQFVARRSPLLRSEKVVAGDDEPEEETDIDSGVQAGEEEPVDGVGGEEEEPKETVEEVEEPTKEEEAKPEEVDDQEGAEEPGEEKGDAPPQDVKANPSKKRRAKVRPAPGPRAPRPTGQPDKLIAKLNKKVERDLRTLQGQPNEDADDDDDTDVDDDTMNDILHGERGKELDKYLQQS